jgi:hypothetical protein
MMPGEGQTPETLCSGQCYHAQCIKNYFLYTLFEDGNCEEFDDVKTLNGGGLCKIIVHTPAVFFFCNFVLKL